MAIDPARAYHYGAFVEAAYAMFRPGDLAPPVTATFPAGYELALYLTGVDRVGRKTEREFFGFVARSAAGAPAAELVIAIRGTDTVLEWLVDAEFLPVPFRAVPDAGLVEDGFDSVYATLAAHTPAGEPQDLHAFLRGAASGGGGAPLTIVGHSLGASVATLLALDVAVNDGIGDLTLYTLASPRTGDEAFARAFDARVPASWRVVNAPDLVPKIPPLYTHVSAPHEVDSVAAGGVRHAIACYHSLATYLYLLNPQGPPGLGQCQG